MHVTVDTATPALLRLAAGVTVAQSGPVAGRAVSNLLRSHLIAYNASHANKLGGKRSNFYVQAARSTHMQPTSTGALVSINHLGFRLQWKGGTIRPVNKRYLTIPAVPEAHARAAREFSDLEFGYAPRDGKMVPALVEARQTKIRITRGKKASVRPVETTLGNKAVYWLVRKATIPPHADVMPTAAAMGSAASGALVSFYQRQIDRRSGLASN